MTKSSSVHSFLSNYPTNKAKFDVLIPHCEDRILLEFGIGYSTIFFNDVGKFTASVETSKKMIREFKESFEFRDIEFHVLNIGPVKEWGYPLLPLRFIKNSVSKEIKKASYIARNLSPDFVFVDGRFRVNQILSLIQNTVHQFTICIDDYWDRDSYKILEEFLPEPKKISEDFALFFVDDSVRFAIVNNANLPPLCST